jgi:kynurenine formamidase
VAVIDLTAFAAAIASGGIRVITETIGTHAGQGHHFVPPFPAYFYMHGKGRYGLQCLPDRSRPAAADRRHLFAAPLKIRQGSGSPLCVLALVAENSRA